MRLAAALLLPFVVGCSSYFDRQAQSQCLERAGDDLALRDGCYREAEERRLMQDRVRGDARQEVVDALRAQAAADTGCAEGRFRVDLPSEDLHDDSVYLVDGCGESMYYRCDIEPGDPIRCLLDE